MLLATLYCLLSDFNKVLSNIEKQEGRLISVFRASGLQNAITKCDIIILLISYLRFPYTWSDMHFGPTKEQEYIRPFTIDSFCCAPSPCLVGPSLYITSWWVCVPSIYLLLVLTSSIWGACELFKVRFFSRTHATL